MIALLLMRKVEFNNYAFCAQSYSVIVQLLIDYNYAERTTEIE
jgi:hypothetical protein